MRHHSIVGASTEASSRITLHGHTSVLDPTRPAGQSSVLRTFRCSRAVTYLLVPSQVIACVKACAVFSLRRPVRKPQLLDCCMVPPLLEGADLQNFGANRLGIPTATLYRNVPACRIDCRPIVAHPHPSAQSSSSVRSIGPSSLGRLRASASRVSRSCTALSRSHEPDAPAAVRPSAVARSAAAEPAAAAPVS